MPESAYCITYTNKGEFNKNHAKILGDLIDRYSSIEWTFFKRKVLFVIGLHDSIKEFIHALDFNLLADGTRNYFIIQEVLCEREPEGIDGSGDSR